MFECTESNALRPLPQKKGPSVIFNIQQWERQTASVKRQRSIPSILTASLHQWELSIYPSVIQFNHEVYYAMREPELGTWVDTWITRWEPGFSSLNREIATASPVNHNEATSGSVDTEIALHLRRVSG
jgi:hypothetical protein